MISDVLDRWSQAHATDVVLPGGTTTIDHLAVVGDAIVVIAGRHWNGALSGGPDAEAWTSVADGRADAELPNPLREAASAAEAVRGMVGEQDRVVPLVVLTGGATHADRPEGVLHLVGLAETLSDIRRRSDAAAQTSALRSYVNLLATGAGSPPDAPSAVR